MMLILVNIVKLQLWKAVDFKLFIRESYELSTNEICPQEKSCAHVKVAYMWKAEC